MNGENHVRENTSLKHIDSHSHIAVILWHVENAVSPVILRSCNEDPVDGWPCQRIAENCETSVVQTIRGRHNLRTRTDSAVGSQRLRVHLQPSRVNIL